jgi:glycosyltransferase involved in cell wall biosynthesis
LTQPILTIAIPTFNRARYLELTIENLHKELLTIAPGSVEIIVSDNASPDDTPAILEAAISRGFPVRSIRNASNIGSDANIAQVFNMAGAPYVLILGDDDILVAGTLRFLVLTLTSANYGVVCLRPYGYDSDFLKEHPGGTGKNLVYEKGGDFLAAIGAYITLISACVINKGLLDGVDARQFCGGNLVQVHLVLMAALAARQNLYYTGYSVACKRNNSGGYDFAKVFVAELGRILDNSDGLPKASIRSFERKMMLGYYPTYLLRLRKERDPERLQSSFDRFRSRFGGTVLFWVWLAPIFKLPRSLSILWGCFAVAAGRALSGDLRRGLRFVRTQRSKGR